MDAIELRSREAAYGVVVADIVGEAAAAAVAAGAVLQGVGKLGYR